MHFILDTAQWGYVYCVTNMTGRLHDEDISASVDASLQTGISRMDTAPGYDDA